MDWGLILYWVVFGLVVAFWAVWAYAVIFGGGPLDFTRNSVESTPTGKDGRH